MFQLCSIRTNILLILESHNINQIFLVSIFQFSIKSSAEADTSIQSLMLPLGKSHFTYGANAFQMDLLGLLMVKSLMKSIPENDIEKKKYDEITEAYFCFFKVIIYWMQQGSDYQRTRNM